MLQPFLKDRLINIQNLCEAHKVRRLYAFGSVCTDRFTDKSDIDLLVSFYQNLDFDEYTDNYFALHEHFEKLFCRKIDLLTDNMLSNPYFIKVMEQTKTQLYER